MPGAKLHHHFLAGVVLAAVALVLAFPLIMQPGGLLVGPQFEGRNDLTAQFLAFRAFPKQVLENAGQIPLWNPYLLEGTAWLGNPQSGMFYPLNWTFLLSGEAWLASWMLAVHLWWGGLGLYRLVRRLGRGWIAGVIGGCAYLAAPYLLAQNRRGAFQSNLPRRLDPLGVFLL